MSILEVKGLSFSYPNGKTVLSGADMTLGEGEKLALWGANGCGKTTFFRLLAGLLKPTAGSIVFEGSPLVTQDDFKKFRLRCGFVLQSADDQLFFPEVIDDVCFGPLNQGLSQEEAMKVGYETLDRLGIKDLAHELSYELSGGQKRLVSLATVLSMKPEVLFLDEPTTGLDLGSRNHLINVINGLDVSRIIVSHDPEFLSKTSERYLTINKEGRLVAIEKAHSHTHTHIHYFGDETHYHTIINE